MEILCPGDNPYLEQYLGLGGSSWERYTARGVSWFKSTAGQYPTIPRSESLHDTQSLKSAQVVGAGSKGYWASLVHKAGGDIQAYDRSYGLGKSNKYTDNFKPWYTINKLKRREAD